MVIARITAEQALNAEWVTMSDAMVFHRTRSPKFAVVDSACCKNLCWLIFFVRGDVCSKFPLTLRPQSECSSAMTCSNHHQTVTTCWVKISHISAPFAPHKGAKTSKLGTESPCRCNKWVIQLYPNCNISSNILDIWRIESMISIWPLLPITTTIYNAG